MKLALIQMNVTDQKPRNLKHAAELTAQAVEAGAELVLLPEMFCCPYDSSRFLEYAEPATGTTTKFLSDLSKQHGILLIGGSIPELDEQGQIYNTCFVFDQKGKLLGRHRKLHLFDIDVPGGQYFKESDSLTAGDEITVIDTSFGRIGIAICFDIRFPELHRRMAELGAELILLPASFNMTTGPAHWELLLRARAVDNQLFVAACSSARDINNNYVSYGNSMIVDPWGQVVGRLEDREGILLQDIDLSRLVTVRESLPILNNRRTDLYSLL